MFIHIGNKKVISDKKIIGIFNVETIEMSKNNEVYKDEISENVKAIIIDDDDEVINSQISSYTLMKREKFGDDDLIWSKE